MFHQTSDNQGKTKSLDDPIRYNLNVALELGVMLAWGRPCCLLKDKSLPQLQTDIVGWIYRECDFKNPISIESKIEGFFCEKGLKMISR